MTRIRRHVELQHVGQGRNGSQLCFSSDRNKRKLQFVFTCTAQSEFYLVWKMFMLCYDDTVSIPHYAGQNRTQSLTQNECLSTNGSWQNRFSQAWKSTWIPTRLELDALMRRCLRPLPTSPDTPSHRVVRARPLHEAEIMFEKGEDLTWWVTRL